ncbi:Uncharacterized protein GBIM_20007 [Gryllus bimaculatus]|nr:Uncharacterized protein GBIM_20007 [Gryllus bimaculatus]
MTTVRHNRHGSHRHYYFGQLAGQRWRSKFGRPSKLPRLGDVDPTGSYCPVPQDWLQKKFGTRIFGPLLGGLAWGLVVVVVVVWKLESRMKASPGTKICYAYFSLVPHDCPPLKAAACLARSALVNYVSHSVIGEGLRLQNYVENKCIPIEHVPSVSYFLVKRRVLYRQWTAASTLQRVKRRGELQANA